MTIGILYIAIGDYIVFWKGFYETSMKYLLPEDEKHYFVFSDRHIETPSNVTLVYQEDNGWIYNTLNRFEMFLNIKDKIQSFDYLFFFNGNTLFKRVVLPKDIIPTADEDYLVGLSWHTFLIKNRDQYPYDRNPDSTAYIPYGQGQCYYQGGLNGGRTPEYLRLIESCCNAVRKDEESDVMAVTYDESHINKYLLNKNIKTISTTYGRPEEWFFPFYPRIIFRDKFKVFKKEKMFTSNNIHKQKGFIFKRVFEDLYKYVNYKIWQLRNK